MYSLFFAIRLSTGSINIIYLLKNNIDLQFTILLTAIF